jgi:hypothetical protein
MLKGRIIIKQLIEKGVAMPSSKQISWQLLGRIEKNLKNVNNAVCTTQ